MIDEMLGDPPPLDGGDSPELKRRKIGDDKGKSPVVDLSRMPTARSKMSHITAEVGLTAHEDPRVLRMRKCRRGESDRHDKDGELVIVIEVVGDDRATFVGSIRAATSKLSIRVESVGGFDSAQTIGDCVATFLDKLADDPVFFVKSIGIFSGSCHVCGSEFTEKESAREGIDARCQEYVASALRSARIKGPSDRWYQIDRQF